MIRFWRIVQILALTAAVTAPLSAQRGVDIGPFAGYYLPFGRFDPASVYSSDLPTEPSELRGIAWGADVRLSLHDRLGAEAIVSTAGSTLRGTVSPGNGRLLQSNERVNLAVVEGQYDVAPVPANYHILLSAGPAFIQHTGQGYAQYGSPRSWGGAFGVEFMRPVASQLQIGGERHWRRILVQPRLPARAWIAV